MKLRQYLFAVAKQINAMRGPVKVNEFDVITNRESSNITKMIANHDIVTDNPSVRKRARKNRRKNKAARAARKRNRS